MRLGPALAAFALACAGARSFPPPPEGLDPAAARAALARFARAVEAGHWDEALALLSARWRAAYTPGRLAADFAGAGPSAREAAERALAALGAGAPLEVGAGAARLPVGPDRVAVLVAELGSWRVDALDRPAGEGRAPPPQVGPGRRGPAPPAPR